MKNFGRVSGFIRFSENWQPTALPLRAPFLTRSVYKPQRPFFKFTLKPVFEDFGVDWKAPPISKSLIAFLMVPLVPLLFILALVLST